MRSARSTIIPTKRVKILTAQPTAVICTAATSAGIWSPRRRKKGTVQNQIFASMKKMEELKFKYRPFEGEADVWTEETYDTALLCVCRKSGNEMVTGLFNFSNEDRTAWIDMGEFTWKDLFTGEKRVLRGVPVPARGYAWYYRKWD